MLHSAECEYIVLLVVRFSYSETKDVTSLSYYERCDWSVQRPVLYCTARFSSCRFDKQRGLMLRMRIIVLEIAANCVKFIRNAGKRVRAAVAQTGLSFIECSLFVSKRTAQNECKAGI